MFLETGDWVAEQISGQMIPDTKAPGFGGFLMFQNPNTRTKGPLILGRLEGVPVFSVLSPGLRLSHMSQLCFRVQPLWSWGGSCLQGTRADPLGSETSFSFRSPTSLGKQTLLPPGPQLLEPGRPPGRAGTGPWEAGHPGVAQWRPDPGRFGCFHS